MSDRIAPAVIAGLAIGIAFVVVFSILTQKPVHPRIVSDPETIIYPPSLAFRASQKQMAVQTPDAIMKKGTAPDRITNMPLTRVAEQKIGDNGGNNDVIMTMHYGKKARNETVAVTIANNSDKDVMVHTLVLQGYVTSKLRAWGDNSAITERLSVQGLAISDRTAKGIATTTYPYWILAGDSLTAYIQGDFNAEKYVGGGCVVIEPSSSDDNLADTNYCTYLRYTLSVD